MSLSTMPATVAVPDRAPSPPPLTLRHLRYTALAVALPLILIAVWLVYLPGHSPLEWYVTVAWSLPILIPFIGLRGMTKARKRARDSAYAEPPPQICDPLTIVIATCGKANVVPALRRVVASVLDSFPEFFADLQVDVIAEDDCPAYEQIAQIPGIRLVTVPSGYRTANGAIRKARAAQYALEARIAAAETGPGRWVLNLDDDTGAGRDTADEVARFIIANRDERAGKHLGQGVLTYPRELAASRWTWLADSIRPADDVTRFAAVTGCGYPLAGLHGELLLIRSSAEAAVGWDYPNEITEDSHFALRFAAMFPRRSGWFAGRCYGASPETAREFIGQRRRWSSGLTGLVVNRSIPLRLRLFMGYCMATWIIGPLQNVLLVTAVALLLREPNLSPVASPLIVLWAVNMAYVVWQYHLGLRINSQVSGWDRSRLADLILVTVLIPVFALAEGAGGLSGAVQHFWQAARRQEKSFPVIAKNR